MQISEASWSDGFLHLKTADVDARHFAYAFHPGEYEIKEKKNTRTLTVNRYFHALVNKMAAVTKADNDTVKQELVFRYGTLLEEDGKPIGAMLPYNADPSFLHGYPKCFKEKTMDGKQYKCYLIYKRTADMDSKEFARLLDGTIEEAKELGIDTLTPEEVARLAYE